MNILFNLVYSIIFLLMALGKAFAMNPSVDMAANGCTTGPGRLPSILADNTRRGVQGRHIIIANRLTAIANIEVNGIRYAIDQDNMVRIFRNTLQRRQVATEVRLANTGEPADVVLTATSSLPPPDGQEPHFMYGYPPGSIFTQTHTDNIPGYIPGAGAVVVDVHFRVGQYIEDLVNTTDVAQYIQAPEGMTNAEFLIRAFYRYYLERAMLEYSYFVPFASPGTISVLPAEDSASVYMPAIVKSKNFYDFIKMYHAFFKRKISKLDDFQPNSREVSVFRQANPVSPRAISPSQEIRSSPNMVVRDPSFGQAVRHV